MSYGAPPPYNPYGQPGYGAPRQDHPKAQTAMILGVLSLVCCGIFTGIPAYIMGNNALKEIHYSGGALGGEGMAKAGKILGIISIVLFVFGLIVWGILLATGNAYFEFNATSS